MKIDLKTMKDLEKGEIIEVRGISGKPATVDVATEFPGLVRVHAMSGNVYDVTDFDGKVFTLVDYKIVYRVNEAG